MKNSKTLKKTLLNIKKDFDDFDDEYYCLKCGASLNKQKGFSPELPIFVCKKCGNINYGDNLKYPETVWFCDGCNGLLNNQIGFNPNKATHTCTNCGYVNDITENNIIEEGDYTPDFFIEEHGFKVDGLNLIWEIALTEEDMSVGSFEIPTVDGPFMVNIPTNAQDGMRLEIKGRGIKGRKENGNFIVTIHLPKVHASPDSGSSPKETPKTPTTSKTTMPKTETKGTGKFFHDDTPALKELSDLIGLESVKQQIKRMRALLLKNKDSDEPMNLHMCFYGNPGTGKTIVARLIAKILYECGILPTYNLVETDRSGLCGEAIGETGPKTHKKVMEAMGGVLFIDEAYTLANSDSFGSDYGSEAIAALLKDMEDYRGKFCVILAGYQAEMEKMLATNPGFESRINRKIIFSDYSIDEMEQIFKLQMTKRGYSATPDAMEEIKKLFEYHSSCKHFANARTVRNILEQLIELQAVRTLEDDDPNNDTDKTIELQDVYSLRKDNNGNKNESHKDVSAMDELNSLIGLESVKKQVERMRALLIRSKGSSKPKDLHMCFYGNPGTGKTIVARLLADIFYECGILPTNNLIETDRSGLCAEWVGRTSIKTHEKVQQAMGGVLFIDEAYTLGNKGPQTNDFGPEAIAALLKDMEDYRGKFCVILAGYQAEMEEMIATNPGFNSRIARKIVFSDYSIDELEEIFRMHMGRQGYTVTPDAMEELKKVFGHYSKREDFANARTVRNILNQLIEIQAVRMLSDDNPDNDNDTTIELQDVDAYKKENNIL